MSTFEDGILRSLRRIARATDLYSRQLASKHGLTGPQSVCLRVLARLGPTTPSTIAKEMDLSQATVTGIVDRLEAQGLLRRTRDAVDRRRVVVALSERGEEVARSAPSALQEQFMERLAQLPDSERRSIHDTLEHIVEMMGAGNMRVEAALPLGEAVVAADALAFEPGARAKKGEPS